MTEVTRGFCWNQNFVPWGCLPLTCGYIHLLNHESQRLKGFFVNLQQMTIVMRPTCWHQSFGPNGLSAPAEGLCLNVFSSITADFNISSAIRWAIQDQWSSGGIGRHPSVRHPSTFQTTSLKPRSWILPNFTYSVYRPGERISIFSMPEQSSRRAIVLPPASASASALELALASASTNVLSFTLKFLGPHYFQTVWWIWFISGLMTDTGPKFYSVPSPPPCMTSRSRSRT